jgi:hypothetical protein
MAKCLNPRPRARPKEHEAFEVVTGQLLEKWSMAFFSRLGGLSNPMGWAELTKQSACGLERRAAFAS